MTLKELNKIGKKCNTVSTGYITYVGYPEEWKRGIYNGKVTEYYVSTLGRVYNYKKNKYGKLFINDSGYIYTQSYYKNSRTSIMINRLVAETFLKHPKKMIKPEADHIRPNKLDNSIYNIQWLSQVDNLAKRTLSDQSGSNNNSSKYSADLIIKIADDLESGHYSVKDISNKYSIPRETITNIVYKVRWKNILENYKFDKIPDSIKDKNNYTKDDILKVANIILENKLTLREISKVTNVSYDTVLNIVNKKCYKDILKDFDFTKYSMKKSIFSDDEKVKILKLLKEGYNPKFICEKLGIEYTKKKRNGIYDLKRKI